MRQVFARPDDVWVDYAHWLDEQPRSSLMSQVAVWAEIAARPGGAAVHGYVAYDPLREVLYRRRLIREPMGPLALGEQALMRDSFLGVKLYPPMGVQVTGNAGRDFRPARPTMTSLFRQAEVAFGTWDQSDAPGSTLRARIDAEAHLPMIVSAPTT